MDNVILQGTTTDKLVDLISQDFKRQLEALKKELANEQAHDELLTREEACNFLKINSSTLWAWTKKSKVRAYGIANRRYYKRSELIECLIELKK